MPIQATVEQLVELVQKAGVDVEVVEAANPEYSLDNALLQIDEGRKPFIQPTVDDAKLKERDIATTGKISSVMVRAIKDLTGYKAKEGQTWEEAFKEAITELKSAKGTKDSDREEFTRTMQEMQERLTQEHAEALRQEQEKYNTLHTKYTDRDAVEILRSKYLHDMTITGDKGIHAQDLYRGLKENYHVVLNEETKELQFFDKANPSMPAKNSTGARTFDLKEFATGYFEPRGILQTDLRNVSPANAMPKPTTPTQPNPNTKQGYIPEGKQAMDALLQGLNQLT